MTFIAHISDTNFTICKPGNGRASRAPDLLNPCVRKEK